MCLLRGDETGLDGSDGAKRGAGEDEIPGRIPAGVVQVCICGILASAILAVAAVGAAPDELETLLRAVPSPRNKHTRKRLRRELARTLRCAGPGDLRRLLREQLKREDRPDGRYHQAVRALGGPPYWEAEDVRDADRYVDGLSTAERQARVNLPSEMEAALNDPRWRAQSA